MKKAPRSPVRLVSARRKSLNAFLQRGRSLETCLRGRIDHTPRVSQSSAIATTGMADEKKTLFKTYTAKFLHLNL